MPLQLLVGLTGRWEAKVLKSNKNKKKIKSSADNVSHTFRDDKKNNDNKQNTVTVEGVGRGGWVNVQEAIQQRVFIKDERKNIYRQSYS